MQSTLADITLPSAPLGPDSLTHRTFSDLRMWLLTQRTGTLQAMHPVVGRALEEHSDLLENPVGRLLRSAAPVLGVVVDPEGEQTGRWVRDMHKGIKGKGYHSLNPDVFYWTHATFFESQITMRQTFGRPFTAAELDQLYAEHVTWWRRYGMTDKVVPKDWAAFQDYWQRMVEEVLEATVPVLAIQNAPASSFPSPLPGFTKAAWPALGPVIVDTQGLVLRGTLPPVVLDKLGLDWSGLDRARLRTFATAVRTAFATTPAILRRHPWVDLSSLSLRERAERATGLMKLRYDPPTPRTRNDDEGGGGSDSE
jgi:uncharacterized protein (DUF2236 family)